MKKQIWECYNPLINNNLCYNYEFLNNFVLNKLV